MKHGWQTAILSIKCLIYKQASLFPALLISHYGSEFWYLFGHEQLYSITSGPHILTMKKKSREFFNGYFNHKIPVPGLGNEDYKKLISPCL